MNNVLFSSIITVLEIDRGPKGRGCQSTDFFSRNFETFLSLLSLFLDRNNTGIVVIFLKANVLEEVISYQNVIEMTFFLQEKNAFCCAINAMTAE